MISMKRQVVTSPKKIIFQDVPMPEPNDNEVLIKVMRIGICGSDIHVFHGVHPNTGYPVTQGHEVSGCIVKIGSKITRFEINDKVTILPQVVCGECYPCTHGQYHICDNLQVMGFQTLGTASEYIVLDEKYVLKIPGEFSYEQGAMIEPVAVACGALSKIDKLEGKKILVLGAGPIGNLTAQVAKALGAKSVVITEISEFRRKIAKQVGIDYVINPNEVNLKDEIIKIFGSDKFDAILECVGISETITQAINVARKGTPIILVGVYGEHVEIDLNTIQNQELRLIGTLMYQKRDYLQAIELIKTNKICLQPLMTNHFSFRDYAKAYDYIENNQDKTMKVFIDVNE